ncbi:hypothetical protein VDGL01_07518 [Verticillium dahliae]
MSGKSQSVQTVSRALSPGEQAEFRDFSQICRTPSPPADIKQPEDRSHPYALRLEIPPLGHPGRRLGATLPLLVGNLETVELTPSYFRRDQPYEPPDMPWQTKERRRERNIALMQMSGDRGMVDYLHHASRHHGEGLLPGYHNEGCSKCMETEAGATIPPFRKGFFDDTPQEEDCLRSIMPDDAPPGVGHSGSGSNSFASLSERFSPGNPNHPGRPAARLDMKYPESNHLRIAASIGQNRRTVTSFNESTGLLLLTQSRSRMQLSDASSASDDPETSPQGKLAIALNKTGGEVRQESNLSNPSSTASMLWFRIEENLAESHRNDNETPQLSDSSGRNPPASLLFEPYQEDLTSSEYDMQEKGDASSSPYAPAAQIFHPRVDFSGFESEENLVYTAHVVGSATTTRRSHDLVKERPADTSPCGNSHNGNHFIETIPTTCIPSDMEAAFEDVPLVTPPNMQAPESVRHAHSRPTLRVGTPEQFVERSSRVRLQKIVLSLCPGLGRARQNLQRSRHNENRDQPYMELSSWNGNDNDRVDDEVDFRRWPTNLPGYDLESGRVRRRRTLRWLTSDYLACVNLAILLVHAVLLSLLLSRESV